MTETVENLILDLVEWVARKERTYQETMDAWRTSCPRLPVWEDATERRLVETASANGRSLVRVTPAGLALLKDKRPHAYDQLQQRSGEIIAVDHVQLAMPAGQEAVARAFYSGVLGLTEDVKPANLAGRGGAWFRGGALRLHLGVDPDFRPARKAHPALLVRGLTELAARCLAAGYPPVTDEPLEGFDRVYVVDPFGNRIELLERR